MRLDVLVLLALFVGFAGSDDICLCENITVGASLHGMMYRRYFSRMRITLESFLKTACKGLHHE